MQSFSFTRRLFEAFHNYGDIDGLTFKLLSAIMNRHPGSAADEFIRGAFIGILKSAPPTDIVQKDGREIDWAILNIPNQLCQGFEALGTQTAFASVRILFDDLYSPALGIFSDGVHLVACRVLVPRGRSHVSGGTDGWWYSYAGAHTKRNSLPQVRIALSRLFRVLTSKPTPSDVRRLSLKTNSETIFIYAQ